MMKLQKLDFLQIIQQALIIPFKNLNFIIFIFFTSLPLFLFTIIYEIIYQQTIIETSKILLDGRTPFRFFCFSCSHMGTIDQLINVDTSRFFILFISYLGILHFPDLINTVYIIDSASIVYAEGKSMNLNEMFAKFRSETRFKGPVITSMYTLFMSSLAFSGLVLLIVYTYMVSSYLIFAFMFGGAFSVLFVKYIEWSSIWNTAAVISVLEEGKEGDVALVISSYLTRGIRKRGFCYAFVFFVWGIVSRIGFVYYGWNYVDKNWIFAAMIHSFVLCLGNTMKWLVFTVFYYDCKRNSSSQKKSIDVVGESNPDECYLNIEQERVSREANKCMD